MVGKRAVEGKKQVPLKSGEATPMGETLALTTNLTKVATGNGYVEKLVSR